MTKPIAMTTTLPLVKSPAAILLLALSTLTWIGCSGGDKGSEEAAQEEAAAASQPAADAGAVDPVAAMEAQMAAQSAGGAEPEAAEPAPPGEAPFDTTFLDVDSEFFLHARVGEVLDSSLFQMLTGGNLGPLRELENQIGITIRDIDTVTIGVANLESVADEASAAIKMNMPMAGGGMGPGMNGPGAMSPDRNGPGAMSPGAMSPGAMLGGADAAIGPADGLGGAPSVGSDSTLLSADTAMNADAGAADAGAGTASSPGGPGADESDRAVMVIRMKKPVDVESLEGEDLQRTPHGDKAYYRVTAPNAVEIPALYLFDGTTIIFAEEAVIKTIIDEGQDRPRPTADLGFIKTAPHLMIAFAPKDKVQLLKKMGVDVPPAAQPAAGAAPPSSSSGPGADAAAAQAEFSRQMAEQYKQSGAVGSANAQTPAADSQVAPDIFARHTEALAILVDLSEGIGLNVTVKGDSPDGAKAMKDQVETAIAETREQFELARTMLPGVVQQIVEPILESMTATNQGPIVSLTTTLPEEQQAILPMLPMAVMGMMMSGGDGEMMMGDGGFGGRAPGALAQEVISDGQPAANTDELPEGVEVKGLATWGESEYGEQTAAPLHVAIVAMGGPAAQAIGMGKLQISEARSGNGANLKWEGVTEDSFDFDADAVGGFVAVEREMFSEHPPEGVLAGFVLVPPADMSAPLQSLAGTITLQVPAGTRDVLLPARTEAGAGTGDETLDALMMTVSLEDSLPNEHTLIVAYNESPAVGEIKIVTAEGDPVETNGTSWSTVNGRKELMYSLAEVPAANLTARVTVYADLQEVPIPFRFESLSLPEPQELSAEQAALLVWTRGETPEEFPDLIIEAQGRWRTLEPVMSQDMDMPEQGSFDFGSAEVAPGSLGLSTDPEAMTSEEMERAFEFEDDPGRRSNSRQSRSNDRARTTSDEPLQIIVDLIGPLAASAEALGEINVASVKTDIETDLAFETAEFGDGFGDPVDDFVEVDRGSMFGTDHPPGGLRLILKLTPPNQPIGGIAQLNGSLKLRTVRERTVEVLSNLQERVGKPPRDSEVAAKPLTGRELSKMKLKPVVALEPNRIRMRLLEGKDERISDVSVIDLNGVPITDVNASTQEGTGAAQGRTVYTFEFPNGVPQKVGMRIELNMGVRDIEIPIRLRDMPLPLMPTDQG